MDTREQKIARSIDRWISLTANAGSGKTRVLVNRYCDIILSGVDPSGIVAITFTRKAASEMLSRVTKLIEAEELLADNSPARIKMLRRIRERLTGARISTIHSFCSSLLREYPIEADIDPNFIDIPETDKYRLLMDSIEKVIEDTLEFGNDEKKNNLKLLLKILGPGRIGNLIYNFISRTEDIRQADSRKKSSDDIFRKKMQLLNEIFLDQIHLGIQILADSLSIITNANYHPTYKDKLAEITSTVKNIILLFESYHNNKDEAITDEIFDILGILLNSPYLTKDGGINRQKLRKIVIEDLPSYSDMQNSISMARNALEIYQNFKYDEELIRHRNTFLEIVEESNQLYTESKALSGFIDFSDMLIKTHILLKDKSVSSEIRKSIKYLLVDEFQDTNKIQYEIIKLLAPGTFAGSNQGVNLFVVGDEKQSIYGFRNADVRIFLEAANDIAEVNKKLLRSELINPEFKVHEETIPAISSAETIGKLNLSSTFRLQPVIASFTNIVCSEIMDSKKSSYDVGYSDFVCGRNAKNLISGNGLIGKIDIIITDEDKDADYNPEAIQLARKIKILVNNDFVDDKGTAKKIKFGDIAVLLRSRTKLDDLTEAFRKEKVPFAVHSGRGFFDSPEISDILSFLKFLSDNHNDLALASILKSPFFNFDDTLMMIISGMPGNYLYQKMTGIKLDILPNVNHKKMISRAREILRDLISITDEMTISELIGDILEKTAWFGSTAKYESYRQMHANVDKLSAWARKFEKRGFNTIYDFLQDTEMLAKIGSEESEAMTSPDEEVVNIMTIHASKGLEFPVVAIFDTNSEKNNTDSVIQTEELGLSFNILDHKDRTDIPVTPGFHLLNREIIKIKNDAEAKRLLYVAMTRAKDRLIISATFKNSLKGFLNMIFANKYLKNIQLATIPESGTMVEINDNLSLLDNYEIINHPIKYSIKIIKSIDDKIENGLESKVQEPGTYLLGRADSGSYYDTFSPSKIMSFTENEIDYFRNYILGFDSDKIYELSMGNKSDKFAGSGKGTIIHKVLENISSWIKTDGKVKTRELQIEIENVLEQMPEDLSSFEDQIKDELKLLASAPLIQKSARRIQNAENEVFMSIPIGEDILNGTIDMIVRDPAGNMEIWDWKTNKAQDQNDIDKLSMHYQLQMKIYAYLLSMQYPTQQNYKARLLFTAMAKPDADDLDWTRTHEWSRKELLTFGSQLQKLHGEMKKFS